MGIPDDLKIRHGLFERGAVTQKTMFVLNHFSHNGGLIHDELTKEAEKEGFIAAWDGMEIAF
jgi:phosphoribosyl 1,2-cyclic phosphate phosphodiesterase